MFILKLIDDGEEIFLDKDPSLSFQWGVVCWSVTGIYLVIFLFTCSGYSVRKHPCGHGWSYMWNQMCFNLNLCILFFSFPPMTQAHFPSLCICLCLPLLTSLCHGKGIYRSHPAQHVQFSWENASWECTVYGWCLVLFFVHIGRIISCRLQTEASASES